MPQKCETRADEARASRNSCGVCFRVSHTRLDRQAQFLIAVHHVRPELAALLADVAFGGRAE